MCYIYANTGQILVHETGAIEATGHKVISIDVKDGKLSPEDIDPILELHTDEHMVKPKLVYISKPTEIGSIYSKSELENLSDFCKKKNLLLYVDGARLGSALCSKENDIELSDLGKYTDAFYIGATLTHSPSNQIFLIIPNELIEELQKKYSFYIWEKIYENNSAIRLVTSWATQQNIVHEFIEDLKRLI